MRFVLLIGVALALGFASRAAATTSVPPDVIGGVVVRDARIPSLNPHHPGVLIETLVFLVRTDAPKWVAGMTIWP